MLPAASRCALLGLALLLAACESERTAYALTSTGRILGFDVADPAKLTSEVAVSGLPSDESLVQIDFRVANDSYYCLTSEARVCTVNPASGVVTVLNALAYTSEDLVNPVIDFNPVVDVLRVVAAEQNQRVSANDGTMLGEDAAVFFDEDDRNAERAPQLVALAYDRNRQGAAATTLFALDVTTRSLLRVGSEGGTPVAPGSGRLYTVGELPVRFTANAGFDIEPDGDAAYAALATSGSGAALYRIDLGSGVAERIGAIGDGERTVIALAVGRERATDNNLNSGN
jgi:hypothetical protein